MDKPKTTDKKYYNILDGRGGEFNSRLYCKDLEEYNKQIKTKK